MGGGGVAVLWGEGISSARYAGHRAAQEKKKPTYLKISLIAGLEGEVHPPKLHSDFH